MFWILEIFPEWFWWLLLIAGLSGYFLSRLKPLKPYAFIVKIISSMVVATTIFIFGMLYSNNTWQLAAQALQARVDVLTAQSQTANAQIETKVVTRTQVVRQRGENVIRYIERETTKLDETCRVPPEFVSAHNQAAIR